MTKALEASDLRGLNVFRKGKVRDVYDLGETLLVVATDRISAFDSILPTPVPGKGKLLTDFCRFWFDWCRPLVPNHIVSFDVEKFPKELREHAETLRGRSMLVRKARRVDAECVVRGYIAGSAWKEYKVSGTACGIRLPDGLQEGQRLPEPIFTPTTKADAGHDTNLAWPEFVDLLGEETATRVKNLSLKVFIEASLFAEKRGILLADTKFEFGWIDGELSLIDEVLTPDSSRYWDRYSNEPGTSPDNFDKQFVRDYLLKIKWDKKPPVPSLPPEVVENTLKRYQAAYDRLTA